MFDQTGKCAASHGSFQEFEHAENLRLEVFHNGRSLDDMIRLHILHVCDLGARGKLSEAIEHCLNLLENLGERFPRKVTKVDVLWAVWKCKKKMKGTSSEAILRLPDMSDINKLAVMQILNVMILNVYHADMLLSPLISLRMVTLSLDYGLSSISSAGFAFYGVLACACGDVDLGYRCGQLALQLLEKFKSTEFIPRVFSAVYGFINSWRCKPVAALSPLQFAYSVAMETGDIEFAHVNATLAGVSVRTHLERLILNINIS